MKLQSLLCVLVALFISVVPTSHATTTPLASPTYGYDEVALNAQSASASVPGLSGRMTAPIARDATRPSQARFAGFLAAEEGLGDAAATAARIHGNSASSPATSYLYRLEDAATGDYLKTGGG